MSLLLKFLTFVNNFTWSTLQRTLYRCLCALIISLLFRYKHRASSAMQDARSEFSKCCCFVKMIRKGFAHSHFARVCIYCIHYVSIFIYTVRNTTVCPGALLHTHFKQVFSIQRGDTGNIKYPPTRHCAY